MHFYQEQNVVVFTENFDESANSTIHLSLQDPEHQRETSETSKICENEERIAASYHDRDNTIESSLTSFQAQVNTQLTNRPFCENGERNNM